MAKSTGKRCQSKPAKPHKDFPLFAHANGQWAIKVKGRLHYFGLWDDPDAALQEWADQKEPILLTGEKNRDESGGLTVKELADRFLTAKKNRVATGELSAHALVSVATTTIATVNDRTMLTRKSQNAR